LGCFNLIQDAPVLAGWLALSARVKYLFLGLVFPREEHFRAILCKLVVNPLLFKARNSALLILRKQAQKMSNFTRKTFLYVVRTLLYIFNGENAYCYMN